MNLTNPAPAPLGQGTNGSNPMPAAPSRRTETFDMPPLVPPAEREVVRAGNRYALVAAMFVHLTVDEEKRVYARAGIHSTNAMILANLKATEAMRVIKVAPITDGLDKEGQKVETFNPAEAVEYATSTIDGTAEVAYAGMTPALRDLMVLAYGVATSIDEGAAALFIRSRRSAYR